MNKRIVISLGGNALEGGEGTFCDQLAKIESSVCEIVDVIEYGYEVIITHGNGPQVGRILLENEMCKETPLTPLDVCVAMSQGMIGCYIEQALRNEMCKRGIKRGVVVVLTQVLVDKEDECFKNPSKPIGPFYDKVRSEELASKGYILREDSGRGYRRVVGSPKPIEIIEIEEIRELINKGFIVITCGGGGIPVRRDDIGIIKGVSGVIDKDFASSRLGQDIEADKLLIVTAVDQISLNFGKKDEILLDKVNVVDLERYIAEGHFASGSMLPKVEASIEFVKSKGNREAIITSLNKVIEGINGVGGTMITR
ncbi:carbamate kinase-like protein YqeA [Candidatus Borrelia fainii]|uniref:Carbamate kinase n=1 Tax=Candidatus Borrelia fainii TaxID=2518322 RepID=A0ABM8DIR3_9SPIR|nr:carbamate kinase [Candidatus Borrelia fainii]BDU62471.1 carbamate kinase-like protein YqeA [Candidatus Borrelia fainii]